MRALAGAVPRRVSSYLRERLHLNDPLVAGLLDCLESDSGVLLASPGVIARKLSVCRSSLYQALAKAQLAGVEELQMLFRLVHAARVLQQAGSAELAARASGFAEPSSLRRSAARRLGLTVAELRRTPRTDVIIDRWLERRMTRTLEPIA